MTETIETDSHGRRIALLGFPCECICGCHVRHYRLDGLCEPCHEGAMANPGRHMVQDWT